MIERFGNYWRVWRGRGAATVDHKLWAYWALTGRYPSQGKALARLKAAFRDIMEGVGK